MEKQGVSLDVEEAPTLEESEKQQQQRGRQVGDEDVLQFLDSMDAYLTLFESLSSTLRQGWLNLASARHSMGASRVNGALLDLKPHSAATSLQVTLDNVECVEQQPSFVLRKWVSSEDKNGSFEKHRSEEDKPEVSEKASANGAPVDVDSQVQKGRSKSLSVFGTLVSPKLRTAQLSFETALETLVQIANARSEMLSAFHQIQKELKG